MRNSSVPRLFAPVQPQDEKPLMVFLPGLDGTGKLFAPQVDTLRHHFDIRCLAIPENNRQDWSSLAQTVVELIHHIKQSRPLYLCGESYGGCLALQVALTAPDMPERLILINPASSLRQQTVLRWLSAFTAYVPSWIFAASGNIVYPLLANFERIRSSWQQTFIETVRPISQDCVAWRLSMLQCFDVPTPHLQELAMPTALLASGQDRLLPSTKEIERLRLALPNVVTYLLPESGHICLLEDRVDLAQCLGTLDFLPNSSPIEV